MSELVPKVLQAGGNPIRGGGNLLLVYGDGEERALLKVYRRRGSIRRERMKRLSFRFIERKRGVTARERFDLERHNLALWRTVGLDVPSALDRAIPDAYQDEFAMWLEFIPGRTLREWVEDESIAIGEKQAHVERCGADLALRQRLALEMGERDLVMKHGSIMHVLVCEARQVGFDLEGGYARAQPLLDCLSDELAGFARSLERGASDSERASLLDAFVCGYGDRPQLRDIVGYGVAGGGWRRAIKRADDRRRRGLRSKCQTLERLARG